MTSEYGYGPGYESDDEDGFQMDADLVMELASDDDFEDYGFMGELDSYVSVQDPGAMY